MIDLSQISRSIAGILTVEWLEPIGSEQLKEQVGSTTNVLLVLSLLLVTFLIIRRYKNGHRKLPPGPMGLPIVGYLPFLTSLPHRKLHQLREKYGNVFGFYLGSCYTVILADYESIKEAFSKDELLGRPQENNIFQALGVVPSIAASNGPVWREHRRFALHTFRDLGTGKSRMENLIKEEISILLDSISNNAGEPCDINALLTPSMSNNVCALVFGRRIDYDDPKRKRLDKLLMPDALGPVSFQQFFPWLFKLTIHLPFGPFKKLWEASKEIKEFVGKEIQEHENTLNTDDVRDYIDAYLMELEKRKTQPNNLFSRTVLSNTVREIFGAGSETVRTTLDWSLIIMASFPEIQREVQKETDAIIGRERQPSWSDQPKMAYVNATLTEVYRWKSTVPLNLARWALTDTKVQGYDIPAKTIVIASFWSCHHDPKQWKDPDVFNPKRFISEDGRFVKDARVIPFSYGKRSCPGETLGRSEVFLYFTSILQRFKVELADGRNILNDETAGISLRPKPYKLVFRPRLT